MTDDELPKIRDRVRHSDCGDAVAVVTGFPWYPLATVQWEATGRESSENVYLLIKVDD